jgi:hypothetical protein
MGAIPPLPETWPEQRSYIGKINHDGANNLIKDILTDEPHTSFHFVLGRIMEKLIEENRVLAFKDDATVPELAWAGRDIMELRVLSRYVCQSKANLDRFEADVLINGAATMQALLRLHNDLARDVGGKLAPPELHRQHGGLQDAREQAGLGSESPLMARTCAKRVGMEKEYLAFSSVTSALVHPSAISVLKSFDLESYRSGLVSHGLILASKVILDARGHVEKHGYKPAQ